MKSLKILVIAGPTQEPIDPVRFISNRSTGTMGYEIAKEAVRRGHRVVLISGPAQVKPPVGIVFFRVETGCQMLKKALDNFPQAEAVVMAAAVSDYRPQKTAPNKIKKSKFALNLKLVRNPDILATLAKRKKDKILVGFALETENLCKNAVKKLEEKKLDLIVANQLTKKQDVFGPGRTSVLTIDKNGRKEYLKNVSKKIVAERIIEKIEEMAILHGKIKTLQSKFWRRTQVA